METPSDARVLIVEDDDALGVQIQDYLASHGYAPSRATSVPDARVLLASDHPDICLVDIVMPGTSGKVFCREVVEANAASVVMMSSLSDEDTVVSLLEIGADDYLIKPFGMRELLARLRAVLRRQGPRAAPSETPVRQVGQWQFDLARARLASGDGFIRKLTPGEAGILRFLTSSPGTAFSREDLMAVSRTRQHGGSADRSVDNLVRRLRKKIEADPNDPRHIMTVWGKGYRYEP
ncbi:MAG: response regulator transcription factor [Pseudomonadota bacterium]